MTVRPVGPVTLIDGHVHCRPGFDPSKVLNAALLHTDRHAQRLGAAQHDTLLMLAEATGEDAYERFAGADKPVGRWRFDQTGEPTVLRAERDDGRSLWLVQGRQWTCERKLEVLTLASGCREPEGLRDGMPVRVAIDIGLAAGAIVTLPWGFGKWTGDRRSVMLGLLEEYGDRVLVGDSAGRPAGQSDAVLTRAVKSHIPVLPGTDALPIASHERRSGQYGLWVEGTPPQGGVVAWLSCQIRSSRADVAPIGRRDGYFRALVTQVRLRLGAS